ncbi:MAG: lactate utilization protein [Ruminococcaceae bacterium]|nr:lactate utilization protein [Oscillospiraceae bacterium]
MDTLIKETIENLKKNNMDAFYVDTKEEVVPLVKSLLQKGDTVSVGGSVTLNECNVLELLRCGDYNFLDRYEVGLERQDIEKIFRDSFFADAYLASSNAIIKSGELYNVDGNANRVAAIMFGPKSVIIVAGKNKIVESFDEAVKRVKKVAAPKNTKRLSCETYCNLKGECVKASSGCEKPFDGCSSEDRICANYCISSYQRIKNRIKVIIVGEEVGY